MLDNENARTALASLTEDKILFDIAGIEERYDELTRELPGVGVRFAIKSCPVDEVLACLAEKGSGFDAASPNEIIQAISTGVPDGMVHYGNTIKSDWNIAQAYRLGIRDFATDSAEDVRAIAAYAPGSRIFCRLAASGDGALWGLGRKCGCLPADASSVLETARALGLSPSGLSVHVGSQQMTAEAWRDAFDSLAQVIAAAGRRGIFLDYVNLGGGLPARGYFDEQGRPLVPPTGRIFATIRAGIEQLRRASRTTLSFIVEPGRYLVADNGVIRAHVVRLSARRQLDGQNQYWLYLSCGRFNGLYEMDRVQYRLVFPSHEGAECVPAVIAGPTCDSEDAQGPHRSLVQVPRAAASGDPVWILSCGAYSVSYATLGFNGFGPLPCALIPGERVGADGPAR
jgi:ornithine decarboxylase